VTAAARAALGRDDAVVARWEVAPATHRPDNMTTAALEFVRGSMTDGAEFTLFVKTLRPASASPWWPLIPESDRSNVLAALDWLDEPRVYRSALHAHLPTGLRMPHLWHVVETDQQIQLWLEAIEGRGGWDTAAYHRAATVLGRLSGRWPGRRVAEELGLEPRGLAPLWYGKTSQFDLPRLADDALWAHSAFAGDRELRADLGRVVEIVPALIDQLDRLPEGLSHGDACPANMLQHDNGIVALDWSYASISAIGSDLGQLLAGAWVDGTADPEAIAATARTIHDGFVSGLAAEARAVASEFIELAFVTHLLVRAVFDAVATLPDVAPRAAETRVALARFAVDRALSLQPSVC
jgi:hypothetical protein